MAESSQITLRVIFIVHFILSVWASIAFLGAFYIYMNAFVLIFAVWAIICPESVDAIVMYLTLNLISIVMDVMFISIFAPLVPPAEQSGLYRFSLGMSILNLILKPLSCFILYRLYEDRAGLRLFPESLTANYARPQRAGYDTIDQPIPSTPVESAQPHQQVNFKRQPST